MLAARRDDDLDERHDSAVQEQVRRVAVKQHRRAVLATDASPCYSGGAGARQRGLGGLAQEERAQDGENAREGTRETTQERR